MHRRVWLRCTHLAQLAGPGLPRSTHALAPQLARVAQLFHAISDITRLYILERLAQRGRSAGELHEALRVPRPTLSFHLKVLREAGLVDLHREGRWRFYDLCGDTVSQLIEFTRTVLPGAHLSHCPLDCPPRGLDVSRKVDTLAP